MVARNIWFQHIYCFVSLWPHMMLLLQYLLKKIANKFTSQHMKISKRKKKHILTQEVMKKKIFYIFTFDSSIFMSTTFGFVSLRALNMFYKCFNKLHKKISLQLVLNVSFISFAKDLEFNIQPACLTACLAAWYAASLPEWLTELQY